MNKLTQKVVFKSLCREAHLLFALSFWNSAYSLTFFKHSIKYICGAKDQNQHLTHVRQVAYH